MVIPLPQRLLVASLAAMVPTVVFVLATVLMTDPARLEPNSSTGWMPYLLGFVWLPSLLPLAVSRHVPTFAGVLAVMTGVAAAAGYLVVTIDDAQAGFAVFYLTYVGLPLAIAVGLIQAVGGGANRRRWWRGHPVGSPTVPAPAGLRVAALLIDALALGAVLAYPLTALSHARLETVATVGGIALAVTYLAVGTGGAVRTLGQVLVGVAVVDHRHGGPIGAVRATVRGLLIVFEVLAGLVLLGVPALLDLAVVGLAGRSVVDLLLHTAVVVPGSEPVARGAAPPAH